MKKKSLLSEVRQLQKIAGLLKEDFEEDNTKTIEVDGMTGIYMTNVGNTELYSSESTEVGSNFDYFVVTPDKEPKMISVEIDFDPEEGGSATAEYVKEKTGLQDINLCKAIAQDINDELGLTSQPMKEYIEADPESVQEAFQKAGVDMSRPVSVVEIAGHSEDEPYTANPAKLVAELQEIKDTQEETEGVHFDYAAAETFPAEEYGLEGMEAKLSVAVSDAYEYVIFQ